jgi:PAS domain S-box
LYENACEPLLAKGVFVKKNGMKESDKGLVMNGIYESPLPMFACDEHGFVLYQNCAAHKLMGYRADEQKTLWCDVWRVRRIDGSSLSAEACLRILAEVGENSKATEVLMEANGQAAQRMLLISSPHKDQEGRYRGTFNTLVDLSHSVAIERKQAFLSAVVESSDDAIVTKNLHGTITSWNRGAERIFGYQEQEVIGKSITILIPESRLDEEDRILAQIQSGIKVDHFQTVRRTKSGKEIFVSLTVSPVKDSTGKIIGASKIARDITREVETQATLKRYANNLEAINALNRLISKNLDVQKILQEVIDATTRLIGASFGAFSYNNTVGEDDKTNMLYTYAGGPADLFQSALSGTQIVRSTDITQDEQHMSVPVISSDGTVLGRLFFGSPVTGTFEAWHKDVATNIAAQAAVALDNSKLFEEVNRLNAKKDEFIALASHELRTPLTTINGYLQIVKKKLDDPKKITFIDKTLNQVTKLTKLVAEMLDISRIETGKLDFAMEPFDLRESVKDVVDTFRYAEASHTITFAEQGNPVPVMADRMRIEQVITNLLGNAIKYSPQSNRVEVLLEYEDDSVRVNIKDQGIGITEEQQKQLFTRFYRAEGTDKIPGLGIGLYLSKEIIERHGGTVGVESVFGKGSMFYFTLPIAQNK